MAIGITGNRWMNPAVPPTPFTGVKEDGAPETHRQAAEMSTEGREGLPEAPKMSWASDLESRRASVAVRMKGRGNIRLPDLVAGIEGEDGEVLRRRQLAEDQRRKALLVDWGERNGGGVGVANGSRLKENA